MAVCRSLEVGGLTTFAVAAFVWACLGTGCGSCDGTPPETTDARIVDAQTAKDGMTTGDVGGDVPFDVSYPCDSSTLGTTIPASEWVRANTAIRRYRYEADRSADVITLELLDGDRDKLGTLTIDGYFGTGDQTNRTVEAAFERGDEPPLEAETDAVISDNDAFRTRTELTRGGTTVQVRSEFRALNCYANDKPDNGKSHPCARPAPIAEPSFSVPTCGFDVSPTLSVAPNLTTLEYRVSTDADPGLGGLRRGDGMVATIRAVEKGSVHNPQKVAGWLEQTSAGEILGTKAETLFSAAYSDPTWMSHIEDHSAKCASEMRQTEQGLGDQGLRCQKALAGKPGAYRTRRQGAACGESGANLSGDPHMRTIDGASYDFQGAGEYVVATAKVGDPFELQARFEPVDTCRSQIGACGSVSIATAVAAQIGDLRVGVYHGRQTPLWLDGQPVERLSSADLSSLPEGARIHQVDAKTYRFEWPQGETVTVTITDNNLDIDGTFPDSRSGQIVGLWGQYNGIPSDDFLTREGRQLEVPLDRDTMYEDFGDSWRVQSDGSLFDYQNGNSTSTYTLPNFPSTQASIEDLPANLKSQAAEACGDVNQQPDKRWCLLDVVCMCDEKASESTEDLEPTAQSSDMHPSDPLTVAGDVCLDEPAELTYREAREPTCPPGEKPCVHLVREKSGVTLDSELTVDLDQPGKVDKAGDLSESTIPSGTEVNSYLLHLNEVPTGTDVLEGSATFSHEIVGIITTSQKLNATDATLGNGEATYPSDRDGRGPDWMSDRIELTEDKTKLDVSLESTEGLDEIRVVTKAGADN